MRRQRLVLALLILGFAATASAQPAASEDFVADYSEFAVAADDARGSAAGAEILANGGNAADAAAATMLALGVVSPASSGLGGGGFLLYYRASDRTLTILDFRERAPAASTPDMFIDAPEPMPGRANAASQVGGLSSGVPGEPAGVAMMVERFGSMQLADIVAPAERLAREGVPASAATARMSGAFADQMKRDATLRGWFPRGQDAIPEGHVIRRPALARTLREFGRQGIQVFQRGRVAREIVRANRAAGGIMTMQDLADYTVAEREPLRADALGFTWVTMPPPSAGGFTMLQSLSVLSRFPAQWRTIDANDPSSMPRYVHALAESWKGPFVDRQRYFGDPDHVTLMLDAMRAPARILQLSRVFHPTLAMPVARYDFPLRENEPNIHQPEDHGTSHLCVVDSEGNIASVTTTVNLPFGGRYTAAGIVMNDEMDDFAREVGEANAFGLVGGAPNLPAPGKRPVSTMSPTIVFEGERPVLCVGAAGGSRIVTATQQVAMNHLVRGMNSRDAIAAPRVHHQGRPDELRTETFAPLGDDVIASLIARGHAHRTIRNVATVQAIRIHEDGRLSAASDPRKGGRPAGR